MAASRSIATAASTTASCNPQTGDQSGRFAHEIDHVEFRRAGAGMAQQAVHLAAVVGLMVEEVHQRRKQRVGESLAACVGVGETAVEDRKSTRLNSSH